MDSPPTLSDHHAETIACHHTSVGKVVRLMNENIVEWDSDLSLNALAREGGYSRSHLIRVFEEVTGTTPHHFLASIRIQKAKELLLESNASVTQISLSVGYLSFPTFSRTFSSFVGLSPSQFRSAPAKIRVGELALLAKNFSARYSNQRSEPSIRGHIQIPGPKSGAIFVGAFTRGVPQGRPVSGTVMLKPGSFEIGEPPQSRFHLLAAHVPFPTKGYVETQKIFPEWVARLIVPSPKPEAFPLVMRKPAPTDPPLVVSLLGLLGQPT